jgi:hypothetical protein
VRQWRGPCVIGEDVRHSLPLGPLGLGLVQHDVISRDAPLVCVKTRVPIFWAGRRSRPWDIYYSVKDFRRVATR